MDISQEILSNITVFNKYAKFVPTKGRRETWDELCERTIVMHTKKYPHLAEEIKANFEMVKEKKILPSMRCLQFAGLPIELANNRIYNCAYAAANHPAVFHEAMFLLLGGTGFGYSVQKHHVGKLPAVQGPLNRPRRFLIGDSIEGWADAIKVLMKAYFDGKSDPVFDYRDIREKGATLVTSGGKAPGPDPLRICINQVKGVLNGAIGRQLKSIEVHDIFCFIADAVLAGGIRRAAMIALFSYDDLDMMYSKSGQYWELNPQRGRANNSVVLERGVIEDWEYDKVWEIIEMNGTGEPGVFWTNDKDLGTNPCCISGDTSIMTSEGARLVKDLEGEQFTAIIDGGEYQSTEKGFWSTGTKELFKLETVEGFSLHLTEDHRVLTNSGWKELKDIKIGEKLCVQQHDAYSWGSKDDSEFEKGWLLGSLVGDGTFEPSSGRAILKYWHNETYLGEFAKDYLSNSFNTKRSKAEVGCENTITIGSRALSDFAYKYGVRQKQKIPNHKLEEESSTFYAGYLRGFFDADGSVQGNLTKGVSIRLSQVNLEALQQVQRMLLRLGIKSSIYQNRAPAGYRSLPDGVGGNAMYLCQATHELVITKINLVKFSEVVGFNSFDKQDRLDDIISSYRRKPNKEDFLVRVSNIESTGFEEVYDVTIPEVSCFDANGFIAHNCEISLQDTQMCNLTEVNVSDVTSQKELNKRVKGASFIGTLQAGYTDFHYLRSKWKTTCEKEALIGVGQTGIGSGKVLGLSLGEAAKVVVKENERVAKLINIRSAARTTTVKPSGTSSLTVGSSSGIHAWHNDYYIRRMRVGKNESLYKYLVDNFPALIEDCKLKPHLEAVISFPQAAPIGSILRTESYMSLLERVRKFNVEWIREGHIEGKNYHNVSCTISLKPNEWEECGDWMWENREYYTGIAVLPYDGGANYVQAPFEDCTKEKYEELVKYLYEIDLTKVMEISDNTDLTDQVACGGGACEMVYV